MAVKTSKFLIFTGTDNFSRVKNPAYAILHVAELTISGQTEKVVQVRNPWGSDKWEGKYSDSDTSSYNALKAALGTSFKEEPGKFWMSYKDFLYHFSRIYMAHSQEKKVSSATERVEWRQTVELPHENEQ